MLELSQGWSFGQDLSFGDRDRRLSRLESEPLPDEEQEAPLETCRNMCREAPQSWEAAVETVETYRYV